MTLFSETSSEKKGSNVKTREQTTGSETGTGRKNRLFHCDSGTGRILIRKKERST